MHFHFARRCSSHELPIWFHHRPMRWSSRLLRGQASHTPELMPFKTVFCRVFPHIEPKPSSYSLGSDKTNELFFAKPVPQSRMKTALCSAWGWTFLILSCFSHPLSSPAPSSEHNSVYLHPSESACWWLNAAHKGSRKTQTSCKKKGQTQSLDNGRKITTSKHQHLELCGWAFCILWRVILQQGLLKRRWGHRAAVVTS